MPACEEQQQLYAVKSLDSILECSVNMTALAKAGLMLL